MADSNPSAETLLLQHVIQQNTLMMEKVDDALERLTRIEAAKTDDRVDALAADVAATKTRLTRMETLVAPVTALGAALSTFFAQKVLGA